MLQKVRRAGDARAFARNLHRLRIATPALSQRKLARELGVSRSCYARYELGQRIPPAWFAAKAAAYFHTSMEQLFSEEGTHTNEKQTPGIAPSHRGR